MTKAIRKTDTEFFADLIVQHATDSMVFTDPHGLTLWVNEPFEKMSGYTLQEAVGQKPGALLQGDETCQQTVAEIREAIRTRRLIRTELLNYTKDGAAYWIDLTISPVFDGKGQLTHFMSIERDITERKTLIQKTESALTLERDRRRERKVLSQMSEWLFAAQSLEELQNVVTRSMERLFPDTNGELFIYSNSRDVLDRVSHWGTPGSGQHLHADQCWGLRRGRSYCFGTSEIDFCCGHVATEKHPYFCLPIIAHGDTIGLMHIAFPRMVADRNAADDLADWLAPSLEVAQICAEQISLAAANVRLQTELQDRSVKDPLTGLWNRRWFLDMANREIRRHQNAETPLSLVMIDVDHFKKFNDAHGHDAGDAVLKVLAAHLMDMGTEQIFPCRLGGEEFALVCCNTEADAAIEIVATLRKRLSQAPVVYSGSALPGVTVSAGIAQLKSREDLQSLMIAADEALYSAKDAGRDCAIVADRPRGDLPKPHKRSA